MVTHHPPKGGGYRHCGSEGDMIFLVAEGQDSTYHHLNLPLMIIFKGNGFKAYSRSY